MSLQSSRFIGNSSSPNLLQTFHNKNFHDHTNQSTVSKKQNLFKTQAINFLKTSLNGLIKDQLKGYRLQKKLQKQLVQFRKTNQRKQLVDDLHKIQKFRQKQSEQLRVRFQQYQKQKQNKEHVIQQVVSMKKQMVKRKRQQHDRKIQHVRKRFIHSQVEDIQNRLSRADSTMSHKSVQSKGKLITSGPRNIYTSLNQRKLLNHQTEDEQQKRITNYLRKMKHAQSRIIEKEITNEQRIQMSIKSEVKNLTKERNQKEQSMMNECELKLETKMGSFYENLSRSQFQNTTLMMNKSRMKEQLRQRVIKNKQMNESSLVNKYVISQGRTLDNFMRKKADKENLYRNHQRKIDMLRTKSSFMNNTIQTQKQYLQKQSERNIRILYEKMNKIKNLKPNQTITEKQRQSLLRYVCHLCSLLDSDDAFYPEIAEFLTNTKSEFLRKKLEKEEQKAKADKTKKTARFNNKN